MTEQQPVPQPTRTTKRFWLKLIMWTILGLLLLIFAILAVIFSSDRGSQWALEQVLKRQHLIEYRYEAGNLKDGLILKDVAVKLKPVHVLVDHADVSLGWRSIFDREIHLSKSNFKTIQIITQNPPSDEPFKFNQIRLPFDLRLDAANAEHLVIQTYTSKIDFYDIHLQDAVWSGTELQFERSSMDMGYLNLKNANGKMAFEGKYPLDAVADLQIPSLNAINVNTIKVHAKGTLDTIQAGAAADTPDRIRAWGVLRPMVKGVPMFGELKLNNYHLPFLTEQALFAEDGLIRFDGNASGLDVSLNTDLAGTSIPKGIYNGQLHTNFKQLDIQRLTAQLMGGNLDVGGVVNWQNQVSWDVKGRLNDLDREQEVIPEAVRDFLPQVLNANIASQGTLKDGLKLSANVDFDGLEQWQLNMSPPKTEVIDQKKQSINRLLVSWKGLDRAMPYIGWLKSPQGQADIALHQNRQIIGVNADIRKDDRSFLAGGNYTAGIAVQDQNVAIRNFQLKSTQGQLFANMAIQLPNDKRNLKWQADVRTQDFNPQQIHSAMPLQRLTGTVKALGYAEPQKQIIQLQDMNLVGQMNAEDRAPISLTGATTAALIFDTAENGGGFKSYAVQHSGHLNALNKTKGPIQLNISGTTSKVQIKQLFHESELAGKIHARGEVGFVNGLDWNIDAAMVRFRPDVFLPVKGELSGVVKSNGVWSAQKKMVSLERLNVAGHLAAKPLRATGNLSLNIDDKTGWMPTEFKANNLIVSYAKNKLQASGNEKQLDLKVSAPNLSEIHPSLSGKAYGYIAAQTQPRVKASANLSVDQLRFGNALRIDKIKVQGDLPTSATTPAKLSFTVNQLRAGGREVKDVSLTLTGLRSAHVIQLNASNNMSRLKMSLYGGLKEGNNWYGQLRNGEFVSDHRLATAAQRTRLKQRLLTAQDAISIIRVSQDQPAAIVFDRKQSQLSMAKHCWSSAAPRNTKLCWEKPFVASPTHAMADLSIQQVALDDFKSFMPSGIEVTGLLDGHIRAHWLKNKAPFLDARLISQNGKLGIAAEDPQDPPSTLDYERVALTAVTLKEGIGARIDVKTPEMGTGFARFLVHNLNPDPMRPQISAATAANSTTPSRRINGEVAFNDMKIKVLKPFIQDVRALDGNLALAGKISGTLAKPQFDGGVRLKNGRLAMVNLPVNLRNIQAYADISGTQADLKASFNSGPGVGEITGSVDWQNELDVILKLRNPSGPPMRIRQAPMIVADVVPNIDLRIQPSKKTVNVSGNINIPSAKIQMPEATVASVGVSADARVVYENQDLLEVLKAARPWKIEADIVADLGDDIIFEGFGSEIPLTGRLNLRQQGYETAMQARGAIAVSKQVTIDAYGQSVDLERAVANFNGALANPVLDFRASKDVQGDKIRIDVTGTVKKPDVKIRSDGGLTEQEALNALLTGRIDDGSSAGANTEGFKSDVNNTIAAAGLSMGLGGTRALTNEIGRTFGLKGLALDAQGTGDDTQVSLTGYITPDLFIRYGVGVFTPVNKLTLRYQMNQRLYLEASQSLERAIDLFYNWRF